MGYRGSEEYGGGGPGGGGSGRRHTVNGERSLEGEQYGDEGRGLQGPSNRRRKFCPKISGWPSVKPTFSLYQSPYFSGASTVTQNCAINVCIFPQPSCCSPYVRTTYAGKFYCLPIPASTQNNYTCGTISCCPPNGVWSSWTDPGPCPQGCGYCANLTKSRICLSAAQGCPCV